MANAHPSWKMNGFCMMIFYATSSRRMSSFVPSPLEVAEIFPGMTLSGLYAASYKNNTFGVVSELSAFPALVRYKGKKGFYVPCSMVECHEGSLTQKGAWGLKNQTASFEWSEQRSHYLLRVESAGGRILEVRLSARKVSLPVRMTFPFMCVRGNGVVSYHADYAARVHFSVSQVEIPEKSPLAAYALKRKLITTFWESTKIVLHPPESEAVVIPKGVSEGIFQVPNGTIRSAGLEETPEKCGSSCLV